MVVYLIGLVIIRATIDIFDPDLQTVLANRSSQEVGAGEKPVDDLRLRHVRTAAPGRREGERSGESRQDLYLWKSHHAIQPDERRGSAVAGHCAEDLEGEDRGVWD